MAAAVPQHVREFQVQVSKAQMTLDFLIALGQAAGFSPTPSNEHSRAEYGGSGKMANSPWRKQARRTGC